MPVSLPYLVSPNSIKACLDKMKAAATPDRVTQDFIKTKLNIKGGTGGALIPYLKKIGFVASDGAPTELYKKFRNHATADRAAADAVRHGYKDLEKVNEYFYELSDKDLLALIIQVTGAESGSKVASLTLSTFKALKAFAVFGGESESPLPSGERQERSTTPAEKERMGTGPKGRAFNLSYTINLNLPATSDQSVFNAIFRSLKENLLDDDEQ